MMNFASAYDSPSVTTAIIISLICIAVVIGILALIIGICSGIFSGVDYVDRQIHIRPKKENKILESDEDAVVALLTATIDFQKETGENARCISIRRID